MSHVQYTIQYRTSIRGEPVSGTMTVTAKTQAAATVMAKNAIRSRFRDYGAKIYVRIINEKEVW